MAPDGTMYMIESIMGKTRQRARVGKAAEGGSWLLTVSLPCQRESGREGKKGGKGKERKRGGEGQNKKVAAINPPSLPSVTRFPHKASLGLLKISIHLSAALQTRDQVSNL